MASCDDTPADALPTALSDSHAAQMASAAELTPVFSYGSNSTAQLRGRLANPALATVKACAPGFARVFCLRSRGWGGGGVASLAPTGEPGAAARGAVVRLTTAELARLDEFEVMVLGSRGCSCYILTLFFFFS